MFDWLFDLWHSFLDPKEVSPVDEDDDEEIGEPGAPIPYPSDAPTPIVDPPTLPESGGHAILPADSEPPLPPPPRTGPSIIVVNPDGRPIPLPKPEPKRVESQIVTVGMWAGSSSLANPIDHSTLAAKYNVNRIDIIVNDHSKWRTSQAFTMRRRDRIMRLKDECEKRGIAVGVMSWVMPHRDYILQMGDALTSICAEIEAVECVLDAEEPWNKAKRPMKYTEAGLLVGASLVDLPCPLAVTGIPYGSTKKLKPLIDQAARAHVQGYTTRSSKRPPATTPPKDVKLWKKKFDHHRPEEAPELEVLAALACYRQSGIKGHTIGSALLAAAESVADMGQREVLYWWLVAMLADKRVARVISILRDQDFGHVEV